MPVMGEMLAERIRVQFSLSLQEDQDLDVECAKKIIDLDSLTSKDGHGITDQMNFSSKSSFDKFWEWFSPPT